MVSYNINHIIVNGEVFQLGGREYIFLTEISHLIINLET